MNTVDENRVVKKKQSGKIRKKGQIDWMITLLPLGLIAALSILFFLLPEQSNTVLAKVRFFLGDTFGVYYLAIGLGVFLLSLYLAFSKYGDIVLGEQDEKPKYSFFAWGSMMFTCGLAADILFYSFAEWVMYAADPQIEKDGRNPGVGGRVPAVSLESDSVGLLSRSRCRIWVYAARAETEPAAVFRSLPSDYGKTDGRHRRTTD